MKRQKALRPPPKPCPNCGHIELHDRNRGCQWFVIIPGYPARSEYCGCTSRTAPAAKAGRKTK